MRSQVFVAVLVVCLLPAHARGQAWVPQKGEGAVSVALSDSEARYHYFTTQRVDRGEMKWDVLLADVTYGVTDKMAVDVALPLVVSKYTGSFPHPTGIDNGEYHSTFSDFRFAVRYNLTRRGAVITPYVGSIVPSHDYQFWAHSAAGKRLNEVQVGVYAAKLLESAVPGLFISGRYGYGFVEQVLDISHNRSVGDLEIGYFITPALRGFVMANAQITHGGIALPRLGQPPLAPALFAVHDQVDRTNFLNLGAGASLSLSESVDVFGSFSKNAAGRNGHALNRAITVGVSWGFKRKPKEPDPGVASRQEGSLIRCICQKAAS